MKRLIGIALVLALVLAVALIIPSSAVDEHFNIDEVSLRNEANGKVKEGLTGTDMGQLKPYAESGATKFFVNGWYYPPKPLLDLGTQTDDGEIHWGGGIVDTGTAGAVKGWGAGWENADWLLRINAYEPLQEGEHDFKVVAKFSDNNTKVIHTAHYHNDDALITQWVNVSSGFGVGQWLQSAGCYSAAAFTANAPFDGVQIPQMWSSRIDAGKSVTFDLSIYAFNGTVANSVAGTPLATKTINPEGDQASGNQLTFDALPAGQYVVAVKFVSGESGAYTVLPESGDPAKALYANSGLSDSQVAKTFNFGVKTTDTANFFGPIPKENIALGKLVYAALNGGTAADINYWRSEYLTDGVAQDTANGNALGWAFATATVECDASAYVDLGALYSVDSIVIVPMQWVPGTTFPGAYELYVSSDGTNWTKVAEQGLRGASTGTNDVFNFDAVEAQYVRLRVISHNGAWGDGVNFFSGYGDLQVFGAKVGASENPDIPVYVPMEYVISRDQLLADEKDVALVGGNPLVTISPALKDKAGATVRAWGWVVSKRAVESYGYSIDGGEIVYNTDFIYDDINVYNLGVSWGIGGYGSANRYNVYIPFETVPQEINVYAKIDGQDILVWTIKVADVYKNYTGAPANDTGGLTAWTGHKSGTLKWQMAFNTDVSFSAINFPLAWALPGTPIQVTIAKDGHFDDGIVYQENIVRPGDGGFILDLGQTIPAGQYVLKMKITDDTLAEEGRYAFYAVYGYATDMLGTDYCLNSSGNVAIELVSADEGTGFIPREIVTRVNVDGVNAGETPIDKADGSTTVLPAGTTAMSFNGWVASNFDIEKYGYRIDGGEVVYDDSFKNTANEADANAIMGAAVNLFGFDANGKGYRCLIDNAIPLTDGEHKVELVALINGKDVTFITYNVKINAPQQPAEITAQVNEAGKLVVTATGTFGEKDWIGVYAEGNTPGGDVGSLVWWYVGANGGTFEVPFDGMGENNRAALLNDDGTVKAGKFVVYLLANDGYDLVEGTEGIAITVEEKPVTEPVTEPETQPQTGDAAVAMFAVIAVLAMGAAVVFMKKRAF